MDENAEDTEALNFSDVTSLTLFYTATLGLAEARCLDADINPGRSMNDKNELFHGFFRYTNSLSMLSKVRESPLMRHRI